MAWPSSGASTRPVGQRCALGDGELQLDEVEPGDELGDRVLDLQPGVHLEEPEPPVRVEQELDGAGPDVADGRGGGDRGVGHPPAQVGVDGGRRRLLDDLLVAALDRALPLVQRARRCRGCRRTPGSRRGGRARRSARRTRCRRRTRPRPPASAAARASSSSPSVRTIAHAPPAAAGRRLDEQRQADLAGVGRRWSRQHRHAGGAHQRLGLDLRAHRGDGRGRRADPRQPGRRSTARANVGRLGEEAVAGVDGVGAGAAGGVDQQVGAQVGVGGGRARQVHGGVAGGDVQGVGVGVAEHGDRADAEAAARAGDAAGDLPPVGDEHCVDHGFEVGRPSGTGDAAPPDASGPHHIRNTP